MIETVDSAEISRFGSKSPNVKFWAYAHLLHNKTWFFVEWYESSASTQPRMLILDSPQLLEQFQTENDVRVVYINTPPTINKSKHWKQEILSCIWVGTCNKTLSPFFIYENKNGIRYREEIGNGVPEIKNIELFYSAPSINYDSK